MIRFILADLRRLWAPALVVVLLVGLATALGVAVTLQERALRLGSARAADRFDLVIGAAGSEVQLVLSTVFLQPAPLPLAPGGLLARLGRDPRVAWAAPVGIGDSYDGYPVVGTTTALLDGLAAGLREGRTFAAEGEAVVGGAVPLPLGFGLHPQHGSAAEPGQTHGATTYRVVGRLNATGTAWDRAILVPIQAVWHVHGLRPDRSDGTDPADLPAGRDEPPASPGDPAHAAGHHHGRIDPDAPVREHFDAAVPGLPAIVVKPVSFAAAYQLRQEYRSGGTLAVFPGEVLTRLYGTLGDARQVLLMIADGASALVAAALVLVTVIHVAQRRRQIGALRAFGAPRHAVLLIVWGEAMLLIVTGIAAGFGLGFCAARVLAERYAGQGGFPLPVAFAPEDAVRAGALLGVAALLALVPAALAYRQSPLAALRA